jgi:ParB family chromosome partitioning protein
VTVIDRPGYDNKTIKELREIRIVKKDGDPKVNPPTEKEHASCPGHAAYVTAYYRSDPQVTYVCTDPKGNGHALYSWSGQTVAPSQQPGGEMTDEQKAERKSLIAHNKNWDSAERVRRAWLSESFVTRTTTPKGAETFLALAVAHGEHVEDGYRLHAELTAKTGETTPGDDWERRYNAKSAITARADAATPKQAVMLAVALLVCEWEAGTSRNTWRRPSDRDRRHLSALIGWGYQPSDVERLILAQPEQPEPVEDDAKPEPVEDDDEV